MSGMADNDSFSKAAICQATKAANSEKHRYKKPDTSEEVPICPVEALHLKVTGSQGRDHAVHSPRRVNKLVRLRKVPVIWGQGNKAALLSYTGATIRPSVRRVE